MVADIRYDAADSCELDFGNAFGATAVVQRQNAKVSHWNTGTDSVKMRWKKGGGKVTNNDHVKLLKLTKATTTYFS